MQKGYTQGTILSLLNSFESDAADNAHDSEYDPSTMTVASMFAGNNENQWLDQVQEEFGSDLSDHDDNNMQNSGTTIKLNKDAKASLAKEMKGEDYDLEGIKSRSSTRTHRTNMTGKTGMTSNRSVVTKKYSLHFSQQKKEKEDCSFGAAAQRNGVCPLVRNHSSFFTLCQASSLPQ